MAQDYRALIDQRVIALYDDFTHVHLDRRLFLERLGRLVGVTAAAAIMPLLRANYASAQQVKPNDPRLAAIVIDYAGATGPVRGYLARPVGRDRRPGIVVIHENRGLSPHIQDVARRLAVAGYVALAPDLLSSVGGTPEDEDEAMRRFSRLKRDDAAADAAKAVDYLLSRPDATGKVGAVGFCWGGGGVNLLATMSPRLAAVVSFYGVAPPLDKVPNIKAALLLHYAGLDDRVNATRPGYEAALKSAGIPYTAYVYEGVNHAFHNDTAGPRYNEAAATLAWQRTLAFFAETLKS
jgi:carboxymethylenebutenolidase